MSHAFIRRCPICADRTHRRQYCEKHEEWSNRPAQQTETYCTWCGNALGDDEAGPECDRCDRKQALATEEMTALEEDYRGRPADDTPDYRWASCPDCGLHTIHVRLYDCVPLIGIFSGQVPGTYESDNFECQWCNERHEL